MAIELEPIKDAPERTALLRFTGILSLRDVAGLKSSVKTLLRSGVTNLLLDLENLKDMDEAVWAVLVSTVRKLRRSNGRVVIRKCPDNLYTQLQARRWDKEFLFPLRRQDHMEALPETLRQMVNSPAPAIAGGAA